MPILKLLSFLTEKYTFNLLLAERTELQVTTRFLLRTIFASFCDENTNLALYLVLCIIWPDVERVLYTVHHVSHISEQLECIVHQVSGISFIVSAQFMPVQAFSTKNLLIFSLTPSDVPSLTSCCSLSVTMNQWIIKQAGVMKKCEFHKSYRNS